LEKLAQSRAPTEEEERRRAFDEFLRKLSDEELDWLLEPIDEAEGLAPCPHHGGPIGCGCRSERRAQRAWEDSPELADEFEHRVQALLERRGEGVVDVS